MNLFLNFSLNIINKDLSLNKLIAKKRIKFFYGDKKCDVALDLLFMLL